MRALSIRQRLSELKAGIAAIGAKLGESSRVGPSPAQSDEPKEGAGVVNAATLDDAYPYTVRRPRLSRYY